MRLFEFSYSPFAAKVRKCLDLKGLAYERVEVPYLDRRELVTLTGGSVHVPVLEDGGRVVGDSSRITAYLDDRYPPSLRTNPLAVVFEHWADNLLEDTAFRLAVPGIEDRFEALQGGRRDAKAMFRLVKERRYGAGCLDEWRRSRVELSERLADLLAPLAMAVADSPFMLGREPSLADAAVFGQLYMVEAGTPGFVASRFPELSAWFRRMGEVRAGR